MTQSNFARDSVEEYVKTTLQSLKEDIKLVHYRLDVIEETQEKHESKTEEILALYNSASVFGKVVTWAIALIGGMAALWQFSKSST